MHHFEPLAQMRWLVLAAVLVVHMRTASAAADAALEITSPVLVVVGPSGVGKTVTINGVLQYLPDLFAFPVSTTTRDRRPGETNGVDYHFVSEQAFAQMEEEGKLLITSPHNGKNYGLSIDALEKAVATGKIVVPQHISAVAAQALKEKEIFTYAKYVIMVPPGHDLEAQESVLRQRLGGRGTETAASVQVRLDDAVNELRYASKKGLFDYVLVNDDLHTAILDFVGYIKVNYDTTRITNFANMPTSRIRLLATSEWCGVVVLMSMFAVVGVARGQQRVRSWCLGERGFGLNSPLLLPTSP